MRRVVLIGFLRREDKERIEKPKIRRATHLGEPVKPDFCAIRDMGT